MCDRLVQAYKTEHFTELRKDIFLFPWLSLLI